jgi:hypothetical protein
MKFVKARGYHVKLEGRGVKKIQIEKETVHFMRKTVRLIIGMHVGELQRHWVRGRNFSVKSVKTKRANHANT